MERIIITALQHHSDRPGGSAKVAADEASYLAEMGHEVWVVAPAIEPSAREYEQAGNFVKLRYRWTQFSPLDPRRMWAHKIGAEALVKKYGLGNAAAVHGHTLLNYGAACDCCHTARKLYTLHSPAPLELALTWSDGTLAGRLRSALGLPWIERMERQCFSRSCGITVLSEFTSRLVSSLYGGTTAERLCVIPGWADLERFQISYDRASWKTQLGWPTDIPVLFTLRRLVPRMGLDTLIRALRQVIDRSQRLHLFIGGAGPLRYDLERLAGELNVSPYCHFLGRVSDEKLPAMYAACDAFVLPTAELECFGLIILEALASGRPVLATPVGAIPEVLGPIEPRWLAEDRSEASLARLLEAFLKGDLPSHAPEDLRAAVRQRYARESQLSKLVSLLLS